jgi:hypothetical protein
MAKDTPRHFINSSAQYIVITLGNLFAGLYTGVYVRHIIRELYT